MKMSCSWVRKTQYFKLSIFLKEPINSMACQWNFNRLDQIFLKFYLNVEVNIAKNKIIEKRYRFNMCLKMIRNHNK